MEKDVAGITNRRSPGFAQTDIGDMHLHRNLSVELEVRCDQILNAAAIDELYEHCVYAKGIVRGLEVGGDITSAQAARLVKIYENAQEQRENVLSDTGR